MAMAILTSYNELLYNYESHKWASVKDCIEYQLAYMSETLSDTNYYTNENGIEVVIHPVDNFPVLKMYEIWEEGYAVTGNREVATLTGTAYARNFAQACDIVMCTARLNQIKADNDPHNKSYVSPRKWDYNPVNLSNWGCKLFWSKELASKSFG